MIDNWFWSNRRIHELHDVMRKGHKPLPAATRLYRNVDTAVMTGAFTEWYAATGAAAAPHTSGFAAG